MDLAVTVIQVIVALGIYNVWLLRFGKATSWRGGPVHGEGGPPPPEITPHHPGALRVMHATADRPQ